jgi:hypothetical protein
MRTVLFLYRKIIYFVCGRKWMGLIDSYQSCSILNLPPIYKNDIVHPCIRYTKETFRGYNWWMVFTPYYSADSTMENPILCHGISENDKPPLVWEFEKVLAETPVTGYNSDPTMFFKERKLHIYWRENDTPKTRRYGIFRGIYGVILDNENITYVDKPVLCEFERYVDREVSPTFLFKEKEMVCYATHIRFKIGKMIFSNKMMNKIIGKLFQILSLLEIYSVQKSYGLAIWKYSNIDTFEYTKTVKLKNCNKLYKPWHCDFFEYENRLYILLQTNQSNADICLGVSEDFENFTLYTQPLLTSKSISKVGIYKPTGGVYNGQLYLYYTAQDLKNRRANQLYCANFDFKELIQELERK